MISWRRAQELKMLASSSTVTTCTQDELPTVACAWMANLWQEIQRCFWKWRARITVQYVWRQRFQGVQRPGCVLTPCFLGGWIGCGWLWSCLDFWSRWSAGSDPTRTFSRCRPELLSGLTNRNNNKKNTAKLIFNYVSVGAQIPTRVFVYSQKIIHSIIKER